MKYSFKRDEHIAYADYDENYVEELCEYVAGYYNMHVSHYVMGGITLTHGN